MAQRTWHFETLSTDEIRSRLEQVSLRLNTVKNSLELASNKLCVECIDYVGGIPYILEDTIELLDSVWADMLLDRGKANGE